MGFFSSFFSHISLSTSFALRQQSATKIVTKCILEIKTQSMNYFLMKGTWCVRKVLDHSAAQFFVILIEIVNFLKLLWWQKIHQKKKFHKLLWQNLSSWLRFYHVLKFFFFIFFSVVFLHDPLHPIASSVNLQNQ